MKKHEYTKMIYRLRRRGPRCRQHRKTLNAASSMRELKYTHIERAIAPVRKLRADKQLLSNIQEKENREGWGIARVLCEM